jgi:hypothetical protein
VICDLFLLNHRDYREITLRLALFFKNSSSLLPWRNVTAIVPFEAVDSFAFEKFEDPSGISREAVVAATRQMLGNDDATQRFSAN